MNIFLGEVMGTMMLIILGDGVVANVLLARSKAENSGWMVIATGWGLAVLMGVSTAIAFGSPQAHINPAVTVAFLVIGNISAADLLPYLAGEFVGAFIGAVVVWLAFLPHWAETPDQGKKLAVFCTAPAIRNAGTNLVAEIIGTIVLVLGVAALFQLSTVASGISVAGGLGPFLVGALVWAIGLSLGGPTGYAINPARDLGPRIAHAVLPIAGKGGSDWGYSWIPVVGPAVGGALAGLLLLVL